MHDIYSGPARRKAYTCVLYRMQIHAGHSHALTDARNTHASHAYTGRKIYTHESNRTQNTCRIRSRPAGPETRHTHASHASHRTQDVHIRVLPDAKYKQDIQIYPTGRTIHMIVLPDAVDIHLLPNTRLNVHSSYRMQDIRTTRPARHKIYTGPTVRERRTHDAR